MAFEKGMPKPPGSGVKKGQKQKPRIEKETVAKILSDLNINVIHQLIKIVTTGKLNDRDKARVWMELLGYVYAKPKAELDVKVEDTTQKKTIVSELGHKVIEALSQWHDEE